MCPSSPHLENPHWELGGGSSGEPETEVRVWLGELLQGLLQVFKPADEQMDILQHQPVSTRRCRLQQLESNLDARDYNVKLMLCSPLI